MSMDDDVEGIKGGTIYDVVARGQKALATTGLFGIMPNDNALRFRDKTTTHLSFIVGAFFIYKNTRALTITSDSKEDYTRCILFFRHYGSVVRYCGAGVKTKFLCGSGGLNNEKRADEDLREMKRLCAEYPGYVKMIQKRTRTDLLLNWRYESKRYNYHSENQYAPPLQNM